MDPRYEQLTSRWKSRNLGGYQRKVAMKDANVIAYVATAFLPALGNVRSVHEIGCGTGRNIDAILGAFLDRNLDPPVLSGNDLVRDACFKFMPKRLRHAITFHEIDTMSYLRAEVEAGRTVDMLISSDHMIHLSPGSISEIQTLIAQYARKYIGFKEATVSALPSRAARSDWFVHDYRFDGFEEVWSDREHKLDPNGEYEVTLLRREDPEVLYGLAPQSGAPASGETDWTVDVLEGSASQDVLVLGPITSALGSSLAARGIGATTLDIYRDGAGKHFPGTPECMPFENGSFDAVVIDGSLAGVFDVDLTFASVERVLRPGGKVVVVARVSSSGSARRWMRRLGWTRDRAQPLSPHRLDEASLRQALSRHGFSIDAASPLPPADGAPPTLRIVAGLR